ncbi:hypothetical protein P171DRAFT_486533 [Karstenula rhodostoma CBS 690.94]|uniref:Uncharacterized protein n=1 Tax=Karstenula rhodostoma CBS 690.94 TaxID=1392251 RepID=A0A9P4PF09_9PLEO|nr:hypothetical protein P171DRAFT_486533 [Karstenula rhodostoma CBS 690.94]
MHRVPQGVDVSIPWLMGWYALSFNRPPTIYTQRDIHPIDDRHFLIPILLTSVSPYFNIATPEHIIYRVPQILSSEAIYAKPTSTDARKARCYVPTAVHVRASQKQWTRQTVIGQLDPWQLCLFDVQGGGSVPALAREQMDPFAHEFLIEEMDGRASQDGQATSIQRRGWPPATVLTIFVY